LETILIFSNMKTGKYGNSFHLVASIDNLKQNFRDFSLFNGNI